MALVINPHINDGVPFNNEAGIATPFEWAKPYPTWLQRIHPFVHGGTPFLRPLTDIPQYSPVKQREYIHIYDASETDFTHNGIRILTPTSCIITEALNEGYELELVHPRDDMAAWYELQEFRIIKAQGQLFRIYKLVKSMSGDSVTVYARHIWYDLGCNYLEDVRPTNLNGQEAIDWILERTFQAHNFTGTSNITDISTAYYQNMSPVKAFLGADNAFIGRWGGELRRDNFTFSINNRRGQDNVFRCTYGIDMTDIVETVDYSEYCTVLLSFDNFGNRRRRYSSQPNPAGLEYVKGIVLTYDEENVAQFHMDADAYMENNMRPSINYMIAFANLKNAEKYKDFINLQRCEIGDTGYINNTRLGISNLQKVIKKTIDAITGDVISVELGSAKRTITKPQRIEVHSPQSPLVAVNNALNQQIHTTQAKSIVSHNDMRKYTHQELSKFTHHELGVGG